MTSQITTLHEKLIAAQLVNKFQRFTESQDLSLDSYIPPAAPNPESGKSSPHLPPYFSYITHHLILLSKRCFLLRISEKTAYAYHVPPIHNAWPFYLIFT